MQEKQLLGELQHPQPAVLGSVMLCCCRQLRTRSSSLFPQHLRSPHIKPTRRVIPRAHFYPQLISEVAVAAPSAPVTHGPCPGVRSTRFSTLLTPQTQQQPILRTRAPGKPQRRGCECSRAQGARLFPSISTQCSPSQIRSRERSHEFVPRLCRGRFQECWSPLTPHSRFIS